MKRTVSREWVATLTALVVVASSLVACQRDPQKLAGPAAKLVEAQGPTSLVEKYAEMVAARQSTPPNPALMETLFREHLADFAANVDRRYGTRLATTAEKALADALRGEQVVVNAQVAEKSVQRAFILSFQQGLTTVAKDVGDDAAYQQILQSSQVLKSIAARRGPWAGVGNAYVEQLDQSLTQLFDAVNRRDQTRAAELAGTIDAFSTKMLVLSVLYELRGLIEARGTDELKAAEKAVEATIYYDSVRASHHARNPKGTTAVDAILAKPLAEMEPELAVSILRTDFQSDLNDVDPKLVGG